MAEIVLIVEDESSLTSVLAERLLSTGHAPIITNDGEEGLKVALSRHPDIILLDLLLPKRDGISMLKLLRQDAWGAKVPVIVLSNLSDPSHIFESLNNGALDYLVKADSSIEDIIQQVDHRLKGLGLSKKDG
jgi:DNA-binding response OmpR family regulator